MLSLLFLIPQEAIIFVVVGAGIAMILGARRLAGALLGAAAMMVILPLLLAPVFDLLPTWALVCLLIVFAVGLLHSVFLLTIGRNSTDHMVGTLAADVVRSTLLAPFRLIGWFARALLRSR